MKLRISALAVLILYVLVSCNKKEAGNTVNSENSGTYFSIKQFAADQWRTYYGQPYGMVKITYNNGQPDSSYTNTFKVDWGTILKTFFETDISDRKYIGHYTFSAFTDEATGTKSYYYEANEDNLPARKLQIMFNKANGRISSVYVEAEKNVGGGKRMQRLYYRPLKLISIQEFGSGRKDLRLEYWFL